MISILTQSILDDGNGKARLALGCRYRHELISGHTSSVSREIFGFTRNDNVINYNGEISLKEYRETTNDADREEEFEIKTDEDLLNNSKVLISLLDLPGNKKHLKTSIYGIIGNAANFSFLVLNATSGLHLGTAKEHLDILLSLNLPFLLVLNKIDLVDETECSNLIRSLSNYLGNKSLKLINDEKDVNNYFFNQSTTASNSMLLNNVPLIKCSCVNGQSIKLIYHFVNSLINSTPTVFNSNLFNSFNTISTIQPIEFLIEDVFYQNDETCVLGGLLLNGKLNRNDQIQIGPTVDGKFIKSRIQSIQRYKVTMNCLKESESGSLELELNNKENLNEFSLSGSNKIRIRKGMIILSQNTDLSAIKIGRRFKARLNVISLKNPIRRGFQCKIFLDNIKQSVYIEQIENGKDEITSGGQYLVTLKFIKHPEVIRVNSNFFLHESTLKATGTIIQ